VKTHKFVKNLLILIFLITLLTLTTVNITHPAETMSTLSMTVSTDNPSYHLRQTITILGNLTSDDSPITDALVAIEIRDPKNNPFYFRTIPIGTPSEEWAIDITEFTLKDLSGNPLTKTTPNSNVKPYITIKNNLLNPLEVVITITICDENLIPIYCGWAGTTLSGGDYTTFSWSFQIPEWAKPGKALVFMNVYNNLPENHGVPYTPEETTHFHIVRNAEIEPSYSPPKTTFNSSAGKYETYIKAPPDRYTRPGTYAIHVTGRISTAVRIYNSEVFTLNDYPCPPQAAFTYSPLQIYQNMTVTFDASSSSAEGYNDTITRYEWTINDPYNPQHIIKSTPLAQHTFEYPGTFVVELNVTDNEELWSTTSKPIVVPPEFGPTANFTWSPPIPMINETVTFDASNSKLGWSAATQEFSPITTYAWNFSDGTTNTTSNPAITHEYTEPGNYTVTLTITDAVDRTDTTLQIVQVMNITAKQCDVTGDGKIDISDIFRTALAYGSEPGDPNWDPACDVYKDDKIDITDIFMIALHYGEDP
jgi:PKD repeat protein